MISNLTYEFQVLERSRSTNLKFLSPLNFDSYNRIWECFIVRDVWWGYIGMFLPDSIDKQRVLDNTYYEYFQFILQFFLHMRE